MTYLITFSTYGSHLHGDRRGSVDPQHNFPGSRLRAVEAKLEAYERNTMNHDACLLTASRREIVLRGIQAACEHRKWLLFAAHVRVNHVHAVVEASCSAQVVLQGLKAYASKNLNALEESRPRWTRHGSTRQLTNREKRASAIHYVACKQGDPMALFVAAERGP